MRAGYSIILVTALSGLLSGCGQDMSQSEKIEPEKVVDPVLAHVGDDQIRKSQLTVLIERLPDEVVKSMDEQIRQYMVESLVRIRAIANEAQSHLAPEERMIIDAKVQAYRDELLAQAYLKNSVKPQRVTFEMIEKYYNENQQEFQDGGAIRYQYLSVLKDKLNESQRTRVLKGFGKAKNGEGWRELAAGLNKEGIPVKFKAANVDPAQISAKLAGYVEKLGENETSDLIFGDQIMIVKVLERSEPTIKPLSAVSSQIRKILAPVQVKKSVAEVSKEVLDKVKVEYENGA